MHESEIHVARSVWNSAMLSASGAGQSARVPLFQTELQQRGSEVALVMIVTTNH